MSDEPSEYLRQSFFNLPALKTNLTALNYIVFSAGIVANVCAIVNLLDLKYPRCLPQRRRIRRKRRRNNYDEEITENYDDDDDGRKGNINGRKNRNLEEITVLPWGQKMEKMTRVKNLLKTTRQREEEREEDEKQDERNRILKVRLTRLYLASLLLICSIPLTTFNNFGLPGFFRTVDPITGVEHYYGRIAFLCEDVTFYGVSAAILLLNLFPPRPAELSAWRFAVGFFLFYFLTSATFLGLEFLYHWGVQKGGILTGCPSLGNYLLNALRLLTLFCLLARILPRCPRYFLIYRRKGNSDNNVDKNVENIGKNVENIGKNVENIGKNVENIDKNVENVPTEFSRISAKMTGVFVFCWTFYTLYVTFSHVIAARLWPWDWEYLAITDAALYAFAMSSTFILPVLSVILRSQFRDEQRKEKKKRNGLTPPGEEMVNLRKNHGSSGKNFNQIISKNNKNHGERTGTSSVDALLLFSTEEEDGISEMPPDYQDVCGGDDNNKRYGNDFYGKFYSQSVLRHHQ